MKKRILIFLDGTWNEEAPSANETNIVRIRDAISGSIRSEIYPNSISQVISRNVSQDQAGSVVYGEYRYIVFYQRGVGTDAGFDRFLGGALGFGLDRNIRRAYKFLCDCFDHEAEVFVFGFSRGAYTARSLVGYVSAAGLLKRGHCTPKLEHLAWSFYRTPPNDRHPGIKAELEAFTHPIEDVRISCLGLFDTVGSLGIPLTRLWRFNRHRYQFHDVEMSPIVQLNLHALAIDENRPQFAATVFRRSKYRGNNSVTEQAWFMGAHSDVGGGYISSDDRDRDTRFIDDIPYDWMLKRVKHHFPDFPLRLEFSPRLIGASQFRSISIHNSRTITYRLSSPALRTVANFRARNLGNFSPVSYDPLYQVCGETIHISVLEHLGKTVLFGGKQQTYAPPNIIIHLDELYGRYFKHGGDGSWPAQSVSITDWSGNIVDNMCDEICRARVSSVVEAAYERLKALNLVSTNR